MAVSLLNNQLIRIFYNESFAWLLNKVNEIMEFSAESSYRTKKKHSSGTSAYVESAFFFYKFALTIVRVAKINGSIIWKQAKSKSILEYLRSSLQTVFCGRFVIVFAIHTQFSLLLSFILSLFFFSTKLRTPLKIAQWRRALKKKVRTKPSYRRYSRKCLLKRVKSWFHMASVYLWTWNVWQRKKREMPSQNNK